MSKRRFTLARRATALTLIVAALAAPSPPAQAATLHECDSWQANARNVDWSDPSRSFANGAIRLIALDTEEPAAASDHLMVLYPDEEGLYLACTLISADGDSGWSAMSLRDASAAYDPATGLTIYVPVGLYNFDTGVSDPTILTVTINQATATVFAQ